MSTYAKRVGVHLVFQRGLVLLRYCIYDLRHHTSRNFSLTDFEGSLLPRPVSTTFGVYTYSAAREKQRERNNKKNMLWHFKLRACLGTILAALLLAPSLIIFGPCAVLLGLLALVVLCIDVTRRCLESRCWKCVFENMILPFCKVCETTFRWHRQLFMAVLWKRSRAHPSPIHVAVNHQYMADGQYPLPLVKAIILFFPHGLNMQGSHGETPLHTLIYTVSIVDDHVIAEASYLVKKGPEALELADRKGYLPLHAALALQRDSSRNDKTVELIKMLIEGFNGAASVPCRQGKLPLHFALRRHANTELLPMLVNLFPDAVAKRIGDKFPHETVYELSASLLLKDQFDSLVRDAVAHLFSRSQLGGGVDLLILAFAGISPTATYI